MIGVEPARESRAVCNWKGSEFGGELKRRTNHMSDRGRDDREPFICRGKQHDAGT